jgi:hypothetical protein
MTDFEDKRPKIESMASMLNLQNNHNASLKTTDHEWQLLHCIKRQRNVPTVDSGWTIFQEGANGILTPDKVLVWYE